jgi:hypothetical protein
MSRKKDKKIDKISGAGWQAALADARRNLFESQQRVRALQRSIGIIEEKIQAGEPWPGTATQN